MSGDDERHDDDHTGGVVPELRARVAELKVELSDALRAVLHNFGIDGAHYVTTHVLTERGKRQANDAVPLNDGSR